MAHVTMTFKTTANRAEIVTTTDLKNFLRVDHSSDDSLIEALRDTAFRWIEDHCNTKLGDVQFDAYLDGFYPHAFRWPNHSHHTRQIQTPRMDIGSTD